MTEKNKTILDSYPSYKADIGIEVHVQLQTYSKIFCACPNQFGDTPNTNICPTCTGHPGTLPRLNKTVVDYAIMAGIATNCTIAETCDFARKHYMYPDLPKNYQITQSDPPICSNGYISINTQKETEKKVRILRIHMEEDAGKNIHGSSNTRLGGMSWVDLNRAGTPLLEVVSYPDMENSIEAKEYLTSLHTIIRYLGISQANMEEGSFRADVNISVRKKDALSYGTRIELKNINSFRFIVNAIEYEIERQITLIESGEKLKQETRLWDNKQQKTIFMRSKEESQDYRYFTEPDLPVIEIDNAWIETIKQIIPELPHNKLVRFKRDYGLSQYEAEILTSERTYADFFEASVKESNKPKQTSNWILRDLFAYLKEQKLHINQIKITPTSLAELIVIIDKGVINSKIAQDVFLEMILTGNSPKDIIQSKGLEQIGSSEELEKIIIKIISENIDNVAKYRAGNEKVFPYFIGVAMKETKGKGNPIIIQELLKKHLNQ